LIQASAKLNPPPLALVALRGRLVHSIFLTTRIACVHAAGNKRSCLDSQLRIHRFGSCF
jgi:hypothetical protein